MENFETTFPPKFSSKIKIKNSEIIRRLSRPIKKFN